MFVLTDHRINKTSLSALRRYGFEPILMPSADYLSNSISAHPDMLLFIGFGKLFCHRRYYDLNSRLLETTAVVARLEIVISDEPTGEKYPDDVLFNAFILDDHLVCNRKTVSGLILDAAENRGFNIIDVPQGYAKCSCTIVSDNAIITADKAVEKACRKHGIEVLMIEKGHVSLPPYEYGFIGGASGLYYDKLCFCGSLDSHPDSDKIRLFCQKHGKTVISLGDEPLQDVGSLIFI